jgi:hypothetical protein
MILRQLVLLLVFFLQAQDNTVRREYTPGGKIIERCFYSRTDYKIRWKADQVMRLLPDTFTVAGLNNAYFGYESGQFVLLKVNQPHGHVNLLALPLNDTAHVQRLHDPLAFNRQSNLLAYVQGNQTIVFVELTTGKTASLKVVPPRKYKSLFLGIHSATLNATELQIIWQDMPSASATKVFRIPKLGINVRHKPRAK